MGATGEGGSFVALDAAMSPELSSLRFNLIGRNQIGSTALPNIPKYNATTTHAPNALATQDTAVLAALLCWALHAVPTHPQFIYVRLGSCRKSCAGMGMENGNMLLGLLYSKVSYEYGS